MVLVDGQLIMDRIFSVSTPKLDRTWGTFVPLATAVREG